MAGKMKDETLLISSGRRHYSRPRAYLLFREGEGRSSSSLPPSEARRAAPPSDLGGIGSHAPFVSD